MPKISDESYALLERLKTQYVPISDITPARGNAKPMLTFAKLEEHVMAEEYIKRIESGENLTEADWELGLRLLYKMVADMFGGV